MNSDITLIKKYKSWFEDLIEEENKLLAKLEVIKQEKASVNMWIKELEDEDTCK